MKIFSGQVSDPSLVDGRLQVIKNDSSPISYYFVLILLFYICNKSYILYSKEGMEEKTKKS